MVRVSEGLLLTRVTRRATVDVVVQGAELRALTLYQNAIH